MRTTYRLAFAAALLAGSAGLALAPPALAKKEEAAKPGLKLSKEFLAPAQQAQAAVKANDFATAAPLLTQLDSLAKNDDEKYIAAALRYDYENQRLLQQQQANPNAPLNQTVLAGPLDQLIANPSTPADMRPKYAYSRGVLSLQGKQYPQAIQYLTQAQQLGYNDPDLPLQLVRAKVEGGDVRGGLADLDAQVAKMSQSGGKAPEDYYRYGIARANAAHMTPETVGWMRKYVQAYPTTKNWHDMILIYGLQQNAIVKLDNPQKVDLFRLLRANNALADQFDYEDYAQKVYDRGLPTEAQAVLKEGQAAGKIPATSSNTKLLLQLSATAIRNEGSLAALETKAKAGANGQLAAQTADAYFGQGAYPKAVELYRAALSKGGVDADAVNTHLGIALARSGDKAGAKEAFAAVKGAPRADIAGLWTSWVDSSPA